MRGREGDRERERARAREREREREVYLTSDRDNMSPALAAAPALYCKVGLRIGWGPGKTELILPSHCDPKAFLQRFDEY